MFQKLNNTPSLNIWDNEHLLFNFRFTLIEKKLDTSHYKKIFNKIISDYSKMTIKQFKSYSGIKKENRINDKNMIKKHHKYIFYLEEKYNSSLKIIYDIYREKKGMRAYGVLEKYIFYLLEINPDHDDRNL